jgi:hypothetical protein
LCVACAKATWKLSSFLAEARADIVAFCTAHVNFCAFAQVALFVA